MEAVRGGGGRFLGVAGRETTIATLYQCDGTFLELVAAAAMVVVDEAAAARG
jgi:hypothetical protein